MLIKSASGKKQSGRLVHMYMQDWLPSTNGTGTNNRIFSNLRAYLDLGYEVEVVCIKRKADFEFRPLSSMDGVTWTLVETNAGDRILDKLNYVVGLSRDKALDYRFKTRPAIRREIKKRIAADRSALHHFEYLDTACGYINFGECRAIWSMHDLESRFSSAHRKIRSEIRGRKEYRWENRAAKYLEFAERQAASQSALTLCIAKHEKEFLNSQWQCAQAEFFPMSLPDETPPARATEPADDDKLRILHLGRIDSLPSYRSLEFLFAEVFPRLDVKTADRLEMRVVGEIRESAKAEKLMALAKPFPYVKFSGFQRDLKAQYRDADLQIVGSTQATGLRTRIIESLAYNVPVLSTTVGAEGVDGLESGENIFLADSPAAFCEVLKMLVDRPDTLPQIAVSGRQLYERVYSRRAVSGRLNALLKRYAAV